MKKKIKDLTIGEFISIARKTKDSKEIGSDVCSECPLGKVEYIECWNYCSRDGYRRKRIDNIINQEIEVEQDGD